jgi:hypothetical protein
MGSIKELVEMVALVAVTGLPLFVLCLALCLCRVAKVAERRERRCREGQPRVRTVSRGHIEREARALAACEGKDFWDTVSGADRARFRREAREIAESLKIAEGEK